MSSICEPCKLRPAEAFERLQGLSGCCWLDSGQGHSALQRFSILAAEPSQIVRAWGNRIEIETAGQIEIREGDSLLVLEEILAARRDGDALACSSGGIGNFSYEFGRRLAGKPTNQNSRWPDYHFQFFDAVYVCDHAQGTASLRARDGESGRTALLRLRQALELQPQTIDQESRAPVDFISNRDQADYCAAVESIRESIAAGEIYQANLAQFFATPYSGNPARLFERLRTRNPAPYSAYLDQGERQILSSSPELFLRITPDRRILTRPIKGTRPRGKNEIEDRAQREALLASPKERAELLMIVDMERNDLGRIAETGSIRVNELYAIESYATVHHLIGEVEARLRPEVNLRDILRATFPGGSITGAPKVQAIEVIARHEPRPRDVFCGAIGWLGDDGTAELNIAIRTITCQEKRAEFGVGAGIVWDSQPEAEYEETLHKAAALFHALRD
ncbi:MAG: aminodeoxychorismate synthase component I [Puniceicoccales bacterium]